jgi:zinc protease
VQGLARSYGVALTSGLTVEDVEAWPDVLAAVTIDEVMEEAAPPVQPMTPLGHGLSAPPRTAPQTARR